MTTPKKTPGNTATPKTATRTKAKPKALATRKAAPASKAPATKTIAAKAMTPKAEASKPETPKPDVLKPEAGKPRHKLIRDSFTIPKSEYALLEALKLRAAQLARPTKKSEVLRAGIAALAAMADKAFIAALDRVPSLKTGRPKGEAKAAQ